jgi:hypothetical protein
MKHHKNYYDANGKSDGQHRLKARREQAPEALVVFSPCR